MREPSTCLEALCLNSREAEGFTVGVVGFEAIGSGSPLDGDGLRLALRAQPLRLGNVHASVAAALALRDYGCGSRVRGPRRRGGVRP